MAEIEALASELQRKIARFALFCAVQPSGEASAPDNAAAVEWVHGALEDLTATALGMELACEQTFLRASQADLLRANQAEKQSGARFAGRNGSLARERAWCRRYCIGCNNHCSSGNCTYRSESYSGHSGSGGWFGGRVLIGFSGAGRLSLRSRPLGCR
ncbi:MAG: hypothetical protein ACXVBV_18050, partial [Isosphaeraceae bacterium]